MLRFFKLLVILVSGVIFLKNCATVPVSSTEMTTPNPPVGTKSDTLDIETGLQNLASQIAKSMTEEKKNRVAILDFTDLQGNISDLGRFISEKLIIKLFETKKFNIIERSKLNKILEEQKFQVSDLVDEESAKRIGKIIGVDAIVIGTVTDLSEQVDINARLLSIETGSVFSVASARVQKDEAVRNLIGRGQTSPTLKGVVEREEKRMQEIKASGNIIEKGAYTFQLKSCSLKGQKIQCEMFITLNADKETGRLKIDYGNTFLITELDKQYPITNTEGTTVTVGVLPYALSIPYISTPPNVPTIIRTSFEISDEKIKIIRVLTLRIDCEGKCGISEPVYVTFRGIEME